MPRGERPLDLDGSALSEFAAGLRALREEAGSPPYRALAESAHFSTTTLSDAAGGRKLPSLAVTLAYVAACGGDRDAWERRWHTIAAELHDDLAGQAAADDVVAPYVGLGAYQPGESDRFFGRERLVEDLVARLRRQRFLAVFGPSGAGKSSVLRAGLIPALRFADPAGPVVLFTPGAQPLRACAGQLAPLLGAAPAEVEAKLATGPGALLALSHQMLADQPPAAEVVYVVDQFEELFTLCAQAEARSAFVSLLLTAAADPRCRVVLGVRSDFYTQCAQDPELAAALQDAQVTVGPMTADELRRAITRPAGDAGCVVESDLLSTLIAHTHGQAGALPLLSHALLQTWRRRKGNTLTLPGFQAVGGLDGALARTAEAVFSGLSTVQQNNARQLFRRLVALGDSTEDTKRRVSRGELDDTPGTTELLDILSEARLITLDRDAVELTHEALIGAWPRLQRWLTADREGHRIHRQLTDATTTWEEHDRDPGTLLRGARLGAVADWAAGREDLSGRERAFLKAGLAAEVVQETAKRTVIRRQRNLIVLLSVLLLVAGGAIVYATDSQRKANHQLDVSLALRAIEDATTLASTNPKLAARVSLAAYRLDPSPSARDGLVSTVAAATSSKVPYTAGLEPGLALDGRTLALRESFLVGLWDIAGHEASNYRSLKDEAEEVRLSADGRLVATVGTDAQVRISSIGKREQPETLAVLAKHARRAALSPDARLLVLSEAAWKVDPDTPEFGEIWSPSGKMSLWDLSDPRRPLEVAGLPDTIFEFHFAGPRTMAFVEPTNPAGPAVQLMDVTDPAHPRKSGVLRQKRADSPRPFFSADGTKAVVANSRGDLTVWDITNPDHPAELLNLNIGETEAKTAAISTATGLVAAADDNGRLMVWNYLKPQEPARTLNLPRPYTANGIVFDVSGADIVGVSPVQRSASALLTWHVDAERAAAVVCGELSPEITVNEWNQYFPGLPYRPSCGAQQRR